MAIRIFLAAVLSAFLSIAALAQTGPGFGGPAGETGALRYNWRMFDVTGDSRAANLYVSFSGGPQSGLSGLNWFNAANYLANYRYQLGLNRGLSGCRTDQYLQDLNFAPILSSNAGWVIFNFPAVNDLAAGGAGCAISPGGSGFPYTNSNGISVTQTNVGQVAASNLVRRIQQVIDQGRNAIVLEEPGATNLSAASVGQQYDLNARLRAYCLVTPRCYMLSLNSAVWNPTGSATLDTFVTGSQIDNQTHYSVLGAQLQGAAFNAWFQSLVPANSNLLLSSINDNNSNNTRQLVNNPLFQTQTGGTNSGGTCVLTGALPSGWTLICGIGTTAVTVTYVSDPSGFGGSCVQLAMTTAGADIVRLQSDAPTTGAWNLTDWFQSSAVVSIANGSSNLAVYLGNNIATNSGSFTAWANYGADVPSGGGANNGPTTAYALTLVTPPATVAANSVTKSFIVGPQIFHKFNAAGSGTSTICRPSFNRIYNYSSSGGFTAQ